VIAVGKRAVSMSEALCQIETPSSPSSLRNFIDIIMPILDGFGATRQIRAIEMISSKPSLRREVVYFSFTSIDDNTIQLQVPPLVF
jgi:CheY-like chemotaxis protein